MAIASHLTVLDVMKQNLRVSKATPQDVAFYDRAAYRRAEQLQAGSPDGVLLTQYLPMATIELLTLLELAWWPSYAADKSKSRYKASGANQVTAFDPSKIIKQNQSMIQLEVYKAVELLFSTLVTDNANVNEKDAENYKFAQKRFLTHWNATKSGSYFYDDNQDGEVTHEEQNDDQDSAYYDGDRRYF